MIEGGEPRSIQKGIVVLLGVREGDTESDARSLADKIASLRIFDDGEDRLNRSLKDIGGDALVVSNFTLYGDCRKGRRPSFTTAASGDYAKKLYDVFVDAMRGHQLRVETGVFQAKMRVIIENEGPVTLLLDTEKQI